MSVKSSQRLFGISHYAITSPFDKRGVVPKMIKYYQFDILIAAVESANIHFKIQLHGLLP